MASQTSWSVRLFFAFMLAVFAFIGSNTTGHIPTASAAFSNKCDGTAANDQNNLRVTPNHGKAFYIDSSAGQSVDAAYVSYTTSNLGASGRSNLWMKLDTFTGGKIQLADPNDAAMPIGDLAATSGKGTSFFLLKAMGTASTAQSHVVHVWSGKPGLPTSTELYSCTYTFTKVSETIKASSNKVTNMTLTNTNVVGDTLTMTVLGATGTIGTSTPDGKLLWFTASARSTWPTQSLRLEGTSIQFYNNASRGTNQKVGSAYLNDTLVTLDELQAITGSTNDKAFYYTAVYTYRIVGATAATATLTPLAQIASGTQVKHTDVNSYSGSTATTVAVSAPTLKLAVNKSVSTSATVSGGVTTFTYTIDLVNSGSNDLTVDQVVDKPDSSLSYVAGSAKFNAVTMVDPSKATGSSDLIFSGPFTVPAGTTRSITYKMSTTTCVSGSFAYTNSATATVGSTSIGSSATTMSYTSASGSCGSTTVTAQTTTVAMPIDVITDTSNVTGNNTATIYGLVDPNGNTGTSVGFEYGTSPTLVTYSSTSVGTTAGETSPYSITKALTGLSSGTVYYYRAVAGTVKGEILSFITTEPVANPTATTGKASNFSLATTITANLNGTIDPNQVVNGAKVKFVYATDSSSGSCTGLGTNVTVPASGFLQDDTAADIVLSGAYPTDISATVTTLTNATYYCYKIQAFYNSSTASWSTPVDGSWVSFYALVKTAQTISFATPANMTVDGTATAGATATSSLTVSYVSSTTDICTISGTTITAVSPGTCSITASQAGNNLYDPADPVTVLFTVNPAKPVISNISLASGNVSSAYSQTLTATGGTGTYTNWTKSSGTMPPGLSLDSSTGVISGTPTTSGTYSVTFTVDSGTLDTGAANTSNTKTYSIVIDKVAQTINFATPSNVVVDATTSATATSSSGLTVTLTGNSNTYCTISGGVVTGVAAGTCSITASQAGDSTYAAATSVTRTFTVIPKAPVISTASLADGTISSAYSQTLAATLGDGTYSNWTLVSGPLPAGLTLNSATGVISGTPTTSGTYAVSFSVDSASQTSATKALSIVISKISQSIAFATPQDMVVADTQSAGATATSTLTVSYISTDTSTCTISVGGTITAVAAGTCEITASQAGNSSYSAATPVVRSFTVLPTPPIVSTSSLN
ncbi:MAG: beta strand repeat-containing protein, partial [Microbacteriaceae bacterium]